MSSFILQKLDIIDLVVMRKEGESNNRLTTKIKTISAIVNQVLPELEIEGITHKMVMTRGKDDP